MMNEDPSVIRPWAVWLVLAVLSLFPLTDLTRSLAHGGKYLIADLEVYPGQPDVKRPEDLDKTAAVPSPNARSFTTDDHAVWLRFTLKPDDGERSLWITGSDTAEVHLFSLSPDGEDWVVRSVRDSSDVRLRLKLGTHLGFDLAPNAAPTQHYIRAVLPAGGKLGILALPSQDAVIQSNRLLTFTMVYLATMIAGLLIVLYMVFEQPTAALAMLLMGHLGSIAISLFVLEFPAASTMDHLFADRAQTLSVLIALSVLPKLLFHLLFLRRFGAAGWAQVFCLSVLLAIATRLGLRISGIVQMSDPIGPVLTLGVLFSVVAMVLTAQRDAGISIRCLRQIYVLQGLPVCAILIAQFWVVPADMQLGFLTQAGGLMSVVLIMMLQYAGYHALDRNRREAMTNLLQSRISRDIAASTLEVQDKLMNMLAHEMRNQLAVARMSMPKREEQTDSARQAAAAISALDDVVTDCVHASWLQRGEWRQRTETVNLTDLLRPLAGADVALDMPDTAPAIVDPMMLKTAVRNLLRVTAGRRPDSMSLRESPRTGWQITIRLRIAASHDPAMAEMTGPATALFNARALVIAMDGQFELIPTEGEWTCHIWLPAR